MARWTNLISRQESTTQKRPGGMVEYRGLVLHTAEGYYEGTISWQKGPNSVSSHFVVGKNPGELCQMMDDADGAWTQRAGNYHWLSSENAGFGSKGEGLSAWQVEANAQLLAEAHRRAGVPLQIAVNPDGRGLGHHSMGCNWPGGAWGHCDCPGNTIIAQKDAVLARARQIISPTPAPAVEGDKMLTLFRIKGQQAVYVSDGIHCRWVQSYEQLTQLTNWGINHWRNLYNGGAITDVSADDFGALAGVLVGPAVPPPAAS